MEANEQDLYENMDEFSLGNYFVMIETVGEETNSTNEARETRNRNAEVIIEPISVNEIVISEATEEVTIEDEEEMKPLLDESIENDSPIESEEEMEAVTLGTTDRNATARLTQIEPIAEKEPYIKMRHFLSRDKYRFVEDLVEAVREVQSKDVESCHRLKSCCCKERWDELAFFSVEQKTYLQKYIRSEERKFISTIKEITRTCHVCVFETCKERFIEKYKPYAYTERGFVNFCAAIAYLGIHCAATGIDRGAKNKAINFICSLLYSALHRGKRSTW